MKGRVRRCSHSHSHSRSALVPTDHRLSAMSLCEAREATMVWSQLGVASTLARPQKHTKTTAKNRTLRNECSLKKCQIKEYPRSNNAMSNKHAEQRDSLSMSEAPPNSAGVLEVQWSAFPTLTSGQGSRGCPRSPGPPPLDGCCKAVVFDGVLEGEERPPHDPCSDVKKPAADQFNARAVLEWTTKVWMYFLESRAMFYNSKTLQRL